MHGDPDGEAHVQPAKPQAQEQARLPCTDGHAGWPRDAEPPPQEGAEAARRLRGVEVSEGPAHASPDPAESRQTLPRSRRLTRGTDIRRILARGKRSRTSHLDVWVSASPVSRVGLIVPRHGHRIVDRNRLKRQLREVLRKDVLPRLRAAPPACDVLVRARREAYDTTFATLQGEIREWLDRDLPRVLP